MMQLITLIHLISLGCGMEQSFNLFPKEALQKLVILPDRVLTD